MPDKLVVVALPEVEARAIVECITASGKMTYTPAGVTLSNGSQAIERALDGSGKVLVHDLETDQDLPVTRVTGGGDGPAVLHLD